MCFKLTVSIGIILVGLFSWFTITLRQISAPDIETTPEAIVDYSNYAEWSPVLEAFGGVEMVLVPAGCFYMGATSEQVEEAFKICEAEGCRHDMFENAQPIHEVCFENAFWIDRYEVDNGQVSNFDTGLPLRESHWSDENHPKESISWLDAYAFCEARSARLPTEAEWEYAARGPASYIFPWGNQFEDNKVVYRNNSGGETAPVGSRDDVSWVGAYDQGGNVSEWVSTIYRTADNVYFPYPYIFEDGREAIDDSIIGSQRVLRGGNWQYNEAMLRTWYRISNNVIDYSNEWGFRCARNTD